MNFEDAFPPGIFEWLLFLFINIAFNYEKNYTLKLITFLQLLGFEVDTINSVQLSNHTGYKVFKGQVLNDQDLSKDYRFFKLLNLPEFN